MHTGTRSLSLGLGRERWHRSFGGRAREMFARSRSISCELAKSNNNTRPGIGKQLHVVPLNGQQREWSCSQVRLLSCLATCCCFCLTSSQLAIVWIATFVGRAYLLFAYLCVCVHLACYLKGFLSLSPQLSELVCNCPLRPIKRPASDNL